MLKYLVENKGSDLHLSTGVAPRIRRRGSIEPIPNQSTLTDAKLCAMFKEIAPADAWEAFNRSSDTDFSYSIPGLARFRVNLFRQDQGAASVMRVIPETIVSLESLKMPASVEGFAHLREGLVVVTGPTGSGKSTTLAA